MLASNIFIASKAQAPRPLRNILKRLVSRLLTRFTIVSLCFIREIPYLHCTWWTHIYFVITRNNWLHITLHQTCTSWVTMDNSAIQSGCKQIYREFSKKFNDILKNDMMQCPFCFVIKGPGYLIHLYVFHSGAMDCIQPSLVINGKLPYLPSYSLADFRFYRPQTPVCLHMSELCYCLSWSWCVSPESMHIVTVDQTGWLAIINNLYASWIYSCSICHPFYSSLRVMVTPSLATSICADDIINFRYMYGCRWHSYSLCNPF